MLQAADTFELLTSDDFLSSQETITLTDCRSKHPRAEKKGLMTHYPTYKQK